ncbi:Dihydrolipoamide acetyltransferase component of pyruvate dehydrogenase complex [Gryllus bimaculatus]|nr:Dihydrolipoamide acetyltransferase component of pyruvate dehydrogenase complex [Gryllus bimaculatus]
MAGVMRVRIGCITKKLVQFSLNNSNVRDKGISPFHRSAFLGVIGTEVKMPSLSPTMNEGTIVKWLKKEGEAIAPGDVICDIQTDKAVVSFEVEEEGILAKILVPENTPDVKIGTLIALMVNPDEDWKSVEVSPDAVSAAASAPKSSGSVGSSSGTPPGTSSGGSSRSSDSGPQPVVTPGASFRTATLMSYGPAVRNLLERYGLKANVITPTGFRSKLLKDDVLKYIKSNKLSEKPLKTVPPPKKAASVSATIPATAKPRQQVLPPKAPGKPSAFVDIQVSGMRRTIAKRLSESKTNIPHSYSTIASDISKIMQYRKKLKEEGIGVSVNDFIVKAASSALQQFPEVNALFTQGQPVLMRNIDISIAVATDAGLITPIVFDVPSKGLVEISSTVRDLAIRARQGKLKPQEFQGGTFTISNLGMFGIKEFSAIINPPQCAILAVGSGQESLNEALKKTSIMRATLSYDRRAFDEGVAAEFMKAVQSMLEDPSMMVVGGSKDLRLKLEA